MCPALMFAARRKERVIGRTVILVVSINTKNGFNQSGAPSGRKWAINILGWWFILEIISDNQRGKPKDRVNRRCLDVLKVYGINPVKLIITIIIRRGDIIFDIAFRLMDMVWFSWCSIVSRMISMGDINRGLDDQKDKNIERRMIMFKIINKGEIRVELNVVGSNIEKISNIIN